MLLWEEEEKLTIEPARALFGMVDFCRYAEDMGWWIIATHGYVDG